MTDRRPRWIFFWWPAHEARRTLYEIHRGPTLEEAAEGLNSSGTYLAFNLTEAEKHMVRVTVTRNKTVTINKEP